MAARSQPAAPAAQEDGSAPSQATPGSIAPAQTPAGANAAGANAADPNTASSNAAGANDQPPEILARGPWPLEAVTASWRSEHYVPSRADSEAADEAIGALRERGSPSHDGVAARLLDFRQDPEAGSIALELQPQRWALRLIAGNASQSVAALCVTRSADGRWLAGRRASWVASWAGRWALGAGGAVDLDENPAQTLVRELKEEWSVTPERVRGEALVRLPHRLVMFVGQAWLAEGAEEEVRPDAEHDRFAWWPREIERWPAEAEAPLRLMARWLSAE